MSDYNNREDSEKREEASSGNRGGSRDRGDRDRERAPRDNEPRETRDREPREPRNRDREPRNAERGAASLLVRNLSYRIYPDEIHRLFSYYGPLKDVYIPKVDIDMIIKEFLKIDLLIFYFKHLGL